MTPGDGLAPVFEDLVRGLAAARSHQAIGAVLCGALEGVLDVQACALYLLDPEDGTLLLAHASGLARTVQEPAALLDGVLGERDPLLVPPRAVTQAQLDALGAGWARSLVLHPVATQGLPVGVLLLASEREQPFQEQAVALASFAATVTALAWERLRQERELLRRNSILSALAQISGRPLHDPSWEAGVAEVLERLGTATSTSRCYVFERHLDEHGAVMVSQRFEWAAPGIMAQIDNPDLQDFSLEANGFSRWCERLDQGEHLAGLVDELPVTEQQVLRPQKIRSILIVPILDEDCWWGFLGFDHCTRDRRWSRAEIDSLRTAAGALGAAIRAARLREDLRRQARLIDTAAGALMVTDGAGRLLSWSMGAQHLLGWTASEVQGQYIGELGLGPQMPAIIEGARPGVHGKQGISFETVVRSKGGREIPVLCTIATVVDGHGWPCEHACAMMDVSLLKRAQRHALESTARLQRALDGTVGSLLRLAEHHDAALATHQQRVAELALAMATTLGWSRERQQAIWLSALLHDIGKICTSGSPAPSSGTPRKERDAAHVLLGRKILEPLDMPWPIATIVAQHHEQPDGRGYPDGLHGEAILPEARVIAVADFVEHHASRLHLAGGVLLRSALDELRGLQGTRFFPDAVEACLQAADHGSFFFTTPRVP